MSDLVRFGVAMDRALLGEFDQRIAARGYENRSEALRDLIRADLTRAAFEGGARVAATLTVVCTPAARESSGRLSEIERDRAPLIVASLVVPLDRERTMQVTALRGRASDLAAMAGQIAGIKGVLSCELSVAAPLPEAG
ncbi:CopG family ribbon-helix-helix protein [Chondromyces apiculatus]|uniref:Nickel responsive regulator NikR n=1 Tax=Chondromyces apiculatus DSM 436 TaxID=1192034 RepID=A0A017TGS0_9BACT|nr:ribbon-helix-helix protein, CopG family [Chondromyces apiculatus]EYF07811.1 Nickel responsive regulator NikR [Chondromyces apiculatus DSM 436]